MADVKTTRKDLYARIMEVMSNDPEVVELCEKQIEQLSRPRKKKVNAALEELAAAVATHMADGGEFTNKELVEWYNADGNADEAVSSQKMAAAMRHLVGMEAVERIAGEKPSDPIKYRIAK